MKANSTSTIKLNGTIENPNIVALIHGVASILHSNIIDDTLKNKIINKDSEFYYFSEEKYINENPDKFESDVLTKLKQIPTHDDIKTFLAVTNINIGNILFG